MFKNTFKANAVKQALSPSDKPVKKGFPRVPDLILRGYHDEATNKTCVLVCTFTGHDLDDLEGANGK